MDLFIMVILISNKKKGDDTMIKTAFSITIEIDDEPLNLTVKRLSKEQEKLLENRHKEIQIKAANDDAKSIKLSTMEDDLKLQKELISVSPLLSKPKLIVEARETIRQIESLKAEIGIRDVSWVQDEMTELAKDRLAAFLSGDTTRLYELIETKNLGYDEVLSAILIAVGEAKEKK